MKKHINNKVYNTASAREIGFYDSNYGVTDFRYYQETLYKKKTGEYFIHGFGNGMSKYSGKYGDVRGQGEHIVPLTFEEAREWAENHLEAGEYEKEFGLGDEEGEAVVFARIPSVLAAKMEQEKSEKGISAKDIIIDALEKRYG